MVELWTMPRFCEHRLAALQHQCGTVRACWLVSVGAAQADALLSTPV